MDIRFSNRLLFVDVILPLPLPRTLTYSVPEEMSNRIKKGVRVIVPLSARKFYSAIVRKIHEKKPAAFVIREIISVLDEQPVVNDLQIKFWHWIADYYMCTVGEVMKAAIPSGLKLESETKVFYNKSYVQCDELSKHEEEIINMVHEKKGLPVSEIANVYKHKDLMRTVQSLVDKEALWVEEVIACRYKPRVETYVRLAAEIKHETQLKPIFDALEKAPKQLEILMNFVRLSGVFSERTYNEISQKQLLLKGKTQTESLNNLVRKKILELYTKEVSRLNLELEILKFKPEPLNSPQQVAIEQIREAFTAKDVVLFHGVTSSGKTEIYIHLIDEQIRIGRQVLYLLPEIALTAQIVNRLKAVFGNKVGIYHSKFSDAERVEVWNNTGNPDGYSVVLGVRSSIFLPFYSLGLVIVDEEHENTYKQFDPAPRYHARDAAIVLASLHGAKTLLGTATPAIESYYNAHDGKYGLVELTQRYAGMELPEVKIVNIALARKLKKMQSCFHPDLLTAIDETLKAGKQVILFQNRRGFAPYIQCRVCEYIPRCAHCDVCLTWHRFPDRLVCHYCGYSVEIMRKCPACGGLDIVDMGFGTEKIEDELEIFFPHAQIARLDLDSSRNRNNYEKILTAFEEGKTDILVGTQMVTKGLDCGNVSLAVVLNADNLLGFPDFRAYERTFQLITQVSGRAGRADKRGLVIIQASKTQHPILQFIIANDYAGMYTSQLAERDKYRYPPFYRIIRLTLKHKSKDMLHLAAKEFAEYLILIFGNRTLGPETPVISRVQNYYLENIWLKIEKQASLPKAKALLAEAMNNIRQLPAYRSLRVVVDVDPM